MRTKFVETESRYQAKKQCPWAEKVTKVCGDICAFNLIMIIKFGKIKITNSQGIHGVPNGYISCEGRCCQEAYEMYIEEWTE